MAASASRTGAPTFSPRRPADRYPVPDAVRGVQGDPGRAGQDRIRAGPAESPAAQTPEELLESSFQSIRASVEAELLTRVRAADPAFFEQLVVDLLVAMGYGGSQADAGRAIGQSGDGGIDGVIKEDRLGLDTIYLQAKRWEGTSGGRLSRRSWAASRASTPGAAC